jgi:hypothetical protein
MEPAGIFQAITALQSTEADQKLIEKIDQEITKISIKAEMRLPKHTNNGWHSQLN